MGVWETGKMAPTFPYSHTALTDQIWLDALLVALLPAGMIWLLGGDKKLINVGRARSPE